MNRIATDRLPRRSSLHRGENARLLPPGTGPLVRKAVLGVLLMLWIAPVGLGMTYWAINSSPRGVLLSWAVPLYGLVSTYLDVTR